MFKNIIISLFLINTTYATITDCSQGSSLFRVNSLGFWPDPAKKNENSTLSYDYTVPASTTISAGTTTYSISYNFIPLSPSVEDLCTQTTCPIVSGKYNQSTSSPFPDVVGSITIKTEWYDTNENLLLCTLVKTTVS